MIVKYIKMFITIFFPFIIVDIGWLASFGSFDLKEVFRGDTFWTLSIFYWLFIMWLPLGLTWEDD